MPVYDDECGSRVVILGEGDVGMVRMVEEEWDLHPKPSAALVFSRCEPGAVGQLYPLPDDYQYGDLKPLVTLSVRSREALDNVIAQLTKLRNCFPPDPEE